LVKFNKDVCGVEFRVSNHKKVYDCVKKMNKKAVTIVAAFLLSDGGPEMVNNVIVASVAG
jgi:predicted metal-dependent HD superfamily phosphohydrolase